MSRTAAQVEASRQNGRKSAGPKSDAGKANSKRNALKHGLRARDVLPEVMQAEVDAEEAGFAATFRPADTFERGLVRQMALASVQLCRAGAAVNADAAGRVGDAIRDWDDARDAQVKHWASTMIDDPAEATSRLERTAEGCDWLGDTWDALLARATDDASWDDVDTATAAALLGLDDPSPDEARLGILEHAESEMARLGTLGDENWDRYDAPDRASAPALALCSPHKDAVRLRSYEQAASRMFYRALNMLLRLRKQGVSASLATDEPEDRATNEPEIDPFAADPTTNEPETAPFEPFEEVAARPGSPARWSRGPSSAPEPAPRR